MKQNHFLSQRTKTLVTKEKSLSKVDPLFHLALLLGLIALLFMFIPKAQAADEGQFMVGALGGNVSLLGDVGEEGGNDLGYGGLLGYAVRDDILANIQYIRSEHKDLSHSEISAGADVLVGLIDPAYTYVSFGVTLVSNEVDFTLPSLIKEKVSSEAFGVYFGGGVDFEITKNLMLGLQGRYNYVFETEEEVNGLSQKIVESNITILARLTFFFGNEIQAW